VLSFFYNTYYISLKPEWALINRMNEQSADTVGTRAEWATLCVFGGLFTLVNAFFLWGIFKEGKLLFFPGIFFLILSVVLLGLYLLDMEGSKEWAILVKNFIFSPLFSVLLLFTTWRMSNVKK